MGQYAGRALEQGQRGAEGCAVILDFGLRWRESLAIPPPTAIALMKPPIRLNHPPDVAVPPDNRPRDGFVYSRVANPTLRQLELTLAELQGRDACLLAAKA